jgi:hypothetical protein
LRDISPSIFEDACDVFGQVDLNRHITFASTL